MSLAVLYSRALSGMEAPLVTVEVHLANGLPAFTIVGLPETEVKESKDRVRAALLNARFEFPSRRITVNLAPADLPKESGRFDLPIALGILAASGQLPMAKLKQYEFAGELALTGDLRAIRGGLAMTYKSHSDGRAFVLPEANGAEAALVTNATVFAAKSLLQVCAHLSGREAMQPYNAPPFASTPLPVPDMAEVKGQNQAKRALEIAASGQHSMLMVGPPGTGKTMLAEEVAEALGMPLLQWHIKSTTKAQQGLYEYDAVSRLRDSQLSTIEGGEKVKNIHNYIVKGVLWQAFTSDAPVALLIDEIDKADIEFPNDLLRELDRMDFFVHETRQTIKAKHRPIIVITSNNEKELPDAFLRRCFFHYIRFPDEATLRKIVNVHFPGLKAALVNEALSLFLQVRELPALKKKPSTSELLDWLKLLLAEDIPLEILREKSAKKLIPPLYGALLKNEADVQLFEKIAFMARR